MTQAEVEREVEREVDSGRARVDVSPDEGSPVQGGRGGPTASRWFDASATRAWLLAPLCCALAIGFYWIVDVPRSPMEGVESPTAKPKRKSPKVLPNKKKSGASPRGDKKTSKPSSTATAAPESGASDKK